MSQTLEIPPLGQRLPVLATEYEHFVFEHNRARTARSGTLIELEILSKSNVIFSRVKKSCA